MFRSSTRPRALWRLVLVGVLAFSMGASGFADAESPVAGGLPRLAAEVAGLIARIAGVEGGLAAEIARAQAAEGVLAAAQRAAELRISGVESGLAAEVARAQAAEGVLGAAQRAAETRLTAAIDAESQRATAAEQGLSDEIDQEVLARQRGDADTLDAARDYTDQRVATARPSDLGFLVDLPCNTGTPLEGRVQVSYSSTPPYTLTLTCAPSQTYSLSVTRTGTGTGTVSGPGINCGADCTEQYTLNQSVTLTAVPAAGSTFAGWTGCTSLGTSCTIVMSAARSVSAAFTLAVAGPTLTVTKTGTGTGTVIGPGINCGADCTEQYTLNQTVTLTATPAAGSTFTVWTGCTTAIGTSCIVTMSASRSVSAAFTLTVASPTLTVTRTGTGTGTVIGPGINCGADCTEQYTLNQTVTLTATPAAGSTFTVWTGCNSVIGSSCTVFMTASRSVSAAFTLAVTGPTLTVTRTGTGTGTVSGPGINCGADCTEQYTLNQSVVLTAAPAAGSTFASWSGCNSVLGTSCTVLMSSSRTVTAAFTLAVTGPTLTVTRAGTGTGTVSGPGIACGTDCTQQYTLNQSVVLTAAPAAGSTFASWSGCNSVLGTSCTVLMSSSRTVTAAFNTTATAYPLTGIVISQVSFLGSGAGTLSYGTFACTSIAGSTRSCPLGTAPAGSLVVFTATPSAGSSIASWGGICTGNVGTTCSRTMPAAPATVSVTFRR